jgi:hypothetical protein
LSSQGSKQRSSTAKARSGRLTANQHPNVVI